MQWLIHNLEVKVKIVRSDNGYEFTSKPIKTSIGTKEASIKQLMLTFVNKTVRLKENIVTY